MDTMKKVVEYDLNNLEKLFNHYDTMGQNHCFQKGWISTTQVDEATPSCDLGTLVVVGKV